MNKDKQELYTSPEAEVIETMVQAGNEPTGSLDQMESIDGAW